MSDERSVAETSVVPDMQMILPTSDELMLMAMNAVQAAAMAIALEQLLYPVSGERSGRLQPTTTELAHAIRGKKFTIVMNRLRELWRKGKIVEPPPEA